MNVLDPHTLHPLFSLYQADFGWAAHIPDEVALPNEPEQLTAARNAAGESASRRVKNPAFEYLKTRRKTYCGTLDYLSPEICRHEW